MPVYFTWYFLRILFSHCVFPRKSPEVSHFRMRNNRVSGQFCPLTMYMRAYGSFIRICSHMNGWRGHCDDCNWKNGQNHAQIRSVWTLMSSSSFWADLQLASRYNSEPIYLALGPPIILTQKLPSLVSTYFFGIGLETPLTVVMPTDQTRWVFCNHPESVAGRA